MRLRGRGQYDESALKVGDSLSQKIDEGLLHSNFGIIVISKNFLKKKWPDYEYRSLLSKEDNFKKIVLPVWYNITYEEVRSYSLYLSDKFALDISKIDIKNITIKLIEIIRPDIYANIQRILLVKSIIQNAPTKTVKLSDLHWGERKREVLPQKLINRIKAIHYVMYKHFSLTLDDTIDCYLREVNPERELEVWETIQVCYLEFLLNENITDKQTQKAVVSQLLLFSIGDVSEKIGLTLSQTKKLYDLWIENFHFA